jgi:hypothetical protein
MKKRSLFAIALCCLTMTPHIHSAAAEEQQEREVVSPVSLNGDVEARENVAQEAPLSPRNRDLQSNNEQELNDLRAAALTVAQEPKFSVRSPKEFERVLVGWDLQEKEQEKRSAIRSAAEDAVLFVAGQAREGAIGITHFAEQAASKATAFLEHQKNAWDQRYFTPRPDINGNGDDLPGAGDTIEIGYPAAFGLKSLAHPTQKQISLDDEKN